MALVVDGRGLSLALDIEPVLQGLHAGNIGHRRNGYTLPNKHETSEKGSFIDYCHTVLVKRLLARFHDCLGGCKL